MPRAATVRGLKFVEALLNIGLLLPSVHPVLLKLIQF